jgi:Fur family transcriptional regulator, ferric uptake regulator
MNEEVNALLGNKNLSRTPCRVEVLRALLDSGSALSETEIRNKLSYNFDRTTIYRTIRSFLDQDVIHGISLEGGEVRYAITQTREKHSGHFHAHFYCDGCNNVYCLSRPEFVPPVLPEGFSATSFDLLINGRCKECN